MARILVAEDDPHVRLLVSSVLTAHGHSLVEVEDGLQALNLFKIGEQVDILITDLVMPHVDGLRLIEVVKQNYPKLPIIAMSAYHDHLEQASAKGADYLLKKPFSHNKLMEAIGAVDKES